MEKPRWYRFFGTRVPFANLHLNNICGNWVPELNGSNTHEFPDSPAIHWLPLKKDISRITGLTNLFRGSRRMPVICDVGCGTGLLSLLLAQTNMANVIGIDPDKSLVIGDGINHSNPHAISQKGRYLHPNLILHSGYVEDLPLYLDTPPEVVISSFMPYEADVTDSIVSLGPEMIVYITEGTEEPDYLERFNPKPGYNEVMVWNGPSSQDVLYFYAYINSLCGRKPSIPKIPEPRDRQVCIHVTDDALTLFSKKVRELDVLDEGLNHYPWESNSLEEAIGSDRYEILRTNSQTELAQLALNKLLTVDPILLTLNRSKLVYSQPMALVPG